MPTKRVLVITLNYNQNNYTISCVDSLLRSTYIDFQIFLIDNGSSNENFEQLKENLPGNDRVLLHRLEKNRGYVGGINYGLQEGIKTAPDYFLIMNNDTIIDRYAIEELVEACQRNDDEVIVTGKVFELDNREIIQTFGNKFRNKRIFDTYKIGAGEYDNGQYDREEERDMIDDIFWLFPSKLYQEIGPYSNWFGFGAEQADYAQRAKKNNYRLLFTPGAKIYHKGNATLGHNIRTPYKAFWSIQSRLMFRWLYVSKSAFLKPYFKTVLEILAAIFYDIIHIFNRKVEKRMARFKLLAFLRFHLWVIYKIPSDKFIPKSIK